MQLINDKLWENLYWTSEWTRPDRLAKILGSIFRKESDDAEHFIYDRQAAKDAMKVGLTQYDHSRHHIDRIDLQQRDIDHFNSVKQHGGRTHLTHRERQHLRQFDKFNNGFELFDLSKSGAIQTRSDSSENEDDISDKQARGLSDMYVLHFEENNLNTTQIDQEPSDTTPTNNVNATKIDKDTDKQYTMSRKAVEKFLREFFNNVHLVGDIIKPRPINARLVKIGKFNTNTKLFSNTVLIRKRSNVHALPLRCKPGDNGGKLKLWLSDRVDQIESILLNRNNHVSIPTNLTV